MEKKSVMESLKIRYVDLKFTLVLLDDCVLPKYKTSALRGGMGQMLLAQNCIRDGQCECCDFERECPVRRMMYSQYEIRPRFATRGDSMGYVVECSDFREYFDAGDVLEFHLLLYGKTIVYFSQFLQAFYMLGQSGLGKEHGRFEIVKVENDLGQCVVDGPKVYLEELGVRSVQNYVLERKKQFECCNIQNKLWFQTPTTLKYQGEFLEKFQEEAIFKSVLRRIYSFNCFEGWEMEYPELEEELPKIVEQKTIFTAIPRFSSTQEGKMKLKGIRGYAIFDSLSEELINILLAGEKLHIGKNTSFGFGKYILQ